MARPVRAAVRRAATIIDRVVRPGRPLLPPAHLRIHYYNSWRVSRFAHACDGARSELVSRGLKPEHRVLDIGSGPGNLALGLLDYLHGGYDGVEIHAESVAWCQRAITARDPRFRFHLADLSNIAYNPHGRTPASAYRFPFENETFDVVFLGSVFTHLMPEDVRQYVREIARMLKRDGFCVASYFLLNDETRAGVDGGRSFLSFDVQHPSGVCRLHDAALPEAAVAFEESFVRQVHDAAGLRMRDIRRGGWWAGERHDQDVVTAGFSAPETAPSGMPRSNVATTGP
jgi:SAM-dependent methyltransferase